MGGDAAARGPSAPRLNTLQLGVLYGNVALYAICYMAQVPVLPYLTQKLGADMTQYGTLQTVFSTIQFVGGLLSGPFVDRYGGRRLFLVSFMASAVCYGLTANASSMWMLYASRVPTILQHAVLAARTIITDASDEADRAAVLGYVGVATGVGFALGPAVGGLLSGVSLQLAAWVATAGSVLSIVLVWALLPTVPHGRPRPSGAGGTADNHAHAEGSHGHCRRCAAHGNGAGATDGVDGHSEGCQNAAGAAVADVDAGGGGEDNGKGKAGRPGGGASAGAGGAAVDMVLKFWRVSRRPRVASLLATKLLSGWAQALFQSVFTLTLKQQFGMGSRGNGMVLSYMGFALIAVQALAVRPTVRALGEARAVRVCLWGMLVSYMLLGCSSQLWHLLLVLLPLCYTGAVASTVNTAQLTKAVPPSDSGTILALDMSLFSGLRMLSPGVGTFLLHRYGNSSIGFGAAAVVAVLILLMQAGVVACSDGPEGGPAGGVGAAGGTGTGLAGTADDGVAMAGQGKDKSA